MPLSAHADRHQDRFGLLGSVTQERGRHVLKGGFEVSRVALRESFGFYVTDRAEAEEAGLGESALAFTPDNPFAFHGGWCSTQVALTRRTRGGPWSPLLVNLGLRFDRTALPTPESQWSPRAAVAYEFPAHRTTYGPPPTASSSRRSRRTCCSRRPSRRGPCRRSSTRPEAVRPCGRRGRAPSRSG